QKTRRRLAIDVLEHVRMIDDIEGRIGKGNAAPEIPADDALRVQPPNALIPVVRDEPATMQQPAEVRILRQPHQPTEVDVRPAGCDARAAAQVDQCPTVVASLDREGGPAAWAQRAPPHSSAL